MNKVLLILFTISLSFCAVLKRCDSKGKINQNQAISTKRSFNPNVDSFFIEYSFSRVSGRSYNYVFKGEAVEIIETTIRDQFINKTYNKDTIKELFRFIDEFCITKTEKLEISRKPRQDTIYADYPMLSIYAYKDNMGIAAYTIHMSQETQEIKYNPLFIRFLDILESLVKY